MKEKMKALEIAERSIHPAKVYPLFIFFCPFCDFSFTAKTTDIDRLFDVALSHLLHSHYRELGEAREG